MNLPYAYGPPPVSGRLRTIPEDFVVDEHLGLIPEGRGEHLWLAVRKRGENTAWVAKQLARLAGCGEREVGYAGLKDRHAVTTQWFSLPAPRQPVDWSRLGERAAAEILVMTRHTRKLRTGTHRANRFLLTVREVEGDGAALEERLVRIGREGVPNYFGEQRFGQEGGNLAAVRAWFAGGRPPARGQQGLLLSSARSHLFNRVLARRVENGTWLSPLPGEPLLLHGKQSFFIPEQLDETLARRLDEGDVHTSGPLWGKDGTQAQATCAAWEQAQVTEEALLVEGLARAGLEPARRPLRVIPQRLHWTLDQEARRLTVGFVLPAGSYATAVMRELVQGV